MFEFKQYIISVTAAAVVGCIAISICDKKSTISAVVKLIVGVIMTLTILKPMIEFKIEDISDYISSVNISATDFAQKGSAWADSEAAAIIMEQCEAYILDKASSAGVQIDVKVTVCDQPPFIPATAVVTGNISPYAKTQLSEMIEKDIGISKENQIWTQ